MAGGGPLIAYSSLPTHTAQGIPKRGHLKFRGGETWAQRLTTLILEFTCGDSGDLYRTSRDQTVTPLAFSEIHYARDEEV